jgi:hypothetical protein
LQTTNFCSVTLYYWISKDVSGQRMNLQNAARMLVRPVDRDQKGI